MVTLRCSEFLEFFFYGMTMKHVREKWIFGGELSGTSIFQIWQNFIWILAYQSPFLKAECLVD